MPEIERAYRKYQNGQVWVPEITEYSFIQQFELSET